MASSRRHSSRLTWRQSQQLFALVMLAPAVLLVFVILGIPIIAGIVTSFQRVRINRPQTNDPFVGLDNYVRMFGSDDFWQSLGVSAMYTVGAVSITFFVGFTAALLVNQTNRINTAARVLLMLPWATPLVAGALTWGIMLDTDSGVINRLIRALPGDWTSVPWLIDERTALLSVIMVDAWHTFPVAMVLLLAGLQGIPQELYESAEVDGATGWQKFRYVTIPVMAPISGIVLLLLSVWAFRRFDVVYLLTRGGPADSTRTLVMETFDRAFRYYDLSYSATLGVATLIVSAMMAAVYIRSLGKETG